MLTWDHQVYHNVNQTAFRYSCISCAKPLPSRVITSGQMGNPIPQLLHPSKMPKALQTKAKLIISILDVQDQGEFILRFKNDIKGDLG